MFEDLITYEVLLEAEPSLFMFGSCVFLRDFGPWKKGDKVNALSFTTEGTPTVQEESEDGKVIKSCKFQLTALPE